MYGCCSDDASRKSVQITGGFKSFSFSEMYLSSCELDVLRGSHYYLAIYRGEMKKGR